MKIFVCVKHVPDSAATIRIVEPNGIDESVTYLLNPYDENAVEAAAQLKAEADDVETIAVTVGKKKAAETLRSALAMGIDRGIHVVSDQWLDSIVIAKALSAAIFQDGTPGIVIAGKAAIDSEGYQTHFRVATSLNMPIATNVTQIKYEGSRVRVTCGLEAGGEQVVQMALPCVIGATKTLNVPRYPKLPDILKARKKEIKEIPFERLNVEASVSKLEVVGMRPAVEERRREILDGPVDITVAELIQRLEKEMKIKLVP